MVYNILPFIQSKYYDELKAYTPSIRQALLFKHITEELPLIIRDSDCIAGWYGYEDGSAPAAAKVSEFPHKPVLNDRQKQLLEHFSRDLNTDVSFTPAHTCIDYGTIIEKGLTHYLSLVDDALRQNPGNDCLTAMQISLNAACGYAGRFAALAQEKAETGKTAEERDRFGKIYTAMCRVPRLGARNFLEAVQSVWIMHTLIPIAEMSWASISIGRLDQYLYPFYMQYLAEGGTPEEAKKILKNLFLLLDTYGDGACAMNIGGMDAEGNDLMNDLSLLLIETEKEMSLRAPIFAVRVTPSMPVAVLDSLIDFDLFKIGQPTFYGELPCRKAMMDRGIEEQEALQFSANSCMGLIAAGREFADMWGIKFNSHLPLELAVNGGQSFNGMLAVPLSTAPAKITGFEQLLQQYGRYFSELIQHCADLYEAVAHEQEANFPDPLLSALTDGCIQTCRDRATGAIYNTVTVETMGLINTCDALAAIKTLVFEQKKYTLDQLIAAAKHNYEDRDDILFDLSKCKKYGANDATVNAICRQVGQIAAAACKKVCRGNRLFLPSLHTLDTNVHYGLHLSATLDGRRSGEPVNKNANPSHLLLNQDHTGVILSAAAVDQTEFSGGQPIDLYFERAWFAVKESRDKIKALIRTYFQQGGLQLQVNSVDIPLLEKAHATPSEYPFVIVRRGGYSVRFSELGEKTREEFIASAKKMELQTR